MSEFTPQPKAHTRQVGILLLVVVGMFCLGFLMAPLYRVLCSITGINGNTPGRITVADYQAKPADTSRVVTVQFDTTINTGLPWDFKPAVSSMQVHPGQLYKADFYAKNNADQAIIGQAIPGITPWQATRFFNKTECFCFTQQTLQAGEAKTMPVHFVVSPDLPQDLTTLTLSYTFMNSERKLTDPAAAPHLLSTN